MGLTTRSWRSALLGRPAGPELADIVEATASELTGDPTDLEGLLRRLSTSGLRSEVRSWLSEGANTRVSMGALRGALGDVALERIAARAGVGRRQVLRGLAGVLPVLVDQLAPHGELLSGDALASALTSALAELRRTQEGP